MKRGLGSLTCTLDTIVENIKSNTVHSHCNSVVQGTLYHSCVLFFCNCGCILFLSVHFECGLVIYFSVCFFCYYAVTCVCLQAACTAILHLFQNTSIPGITVLVYLLYFSNILNKVNIFR